MAAQAADIFRIFGLAARDGQCGYLAFLQVRASMWVYRITLSVFQILWQYRRSAFVTFLMSFGCLRRGSGGGCVGPAGGCGGPGPLAPRAHLMIEN